MNYKVIRNSTDGLVCFGPNDDNYAPIIAIGNVLTIETTMPVPTLAQVKSTAYLSIDATAEQARLKYCSSALLADEYRLAYNDATTWLLNQLLPAPTTVQNWANINIWTPLQAATNIKNAGDSMTAKLIQIRDVRLTGKNNVTLAIDNASAIAAQNTAIINLQAL